MSMGISMSADMPVSMPTAKAIAIAIVAVKHKPCPWPCHMHPRHCFWPNVQYPTSKSTFCSLARLTNFLRTYEHASVRRSCNCCCFCCCCNIWCRCSWSRIAALVPIQLGKQGCGLNFGRWRCELLALMVLGLMEFQMRCCWLGIESFRAKQP